MKKGEGRIMVLIRKGHVLINKEFGEMTMGVLAQIIVNLELLVEELKMNYKLGVKKIEK